jgi:hypothetical protein
LYDEFEKLITTTTVSTALFATCRAIKDKFGYKLYEGTHEQGFEAMSQFL